MSNSGTTTTTTPPPTSPPTTGGSTGGLSASVTALVFGTAQATKTVTFKNNGTATITFSQASLSSTKFVQKNNCAYLAPGATCTAYVTYVPVYAGSKTGTLTMNSNASNGSVGINITGG